MLEAGTLERYADSTFHKLPTPATQPTRRFFMRSDDAREPQIAKIARGELRDAILAGSRRIDV
jgi:hypothetical protein